MMMSRSIAYSERSLRRRPPRSQFSCEHRSACRERRSGRSVSRGADAHYRGRPMTTAAFPPSIELARLYEKTSARGTRYMVGRLDLARITLLPGDAAEDG